MLSYNNNPNQFPPKSGSRLVITVIKMGHNNLFVQKAAINGKTHC